MFYSLIKSGSKLFFKFYLKSKVYGRSNIPRKGSFILASNHVSYLDPLLLAATFRRNLNFIARDKLLKASYIGWVLKHANTIPVSRQGKELESLKKALKILKDGKVLAIFPEGTRSKNGRIKSAKPGVGFLVYKANVPVLPVYIGGTFEAQPRGIKTLKRKPVEVRIGKVLDFRHIDADRSRRDVLYQKISDDIMEKISELKTLADLN